MRKFNFIAPMSLRSPANAIEMISVCPATSTKMRSTNVAGFKKRLFNQIIARGYTLYPIFNRRKHHHTYRMVVGNQLVNLGKTFNYFSKKKIGFYIGSALKTCYTATTLKRAIPSLAFLIETDTARLLVQNQQFFTLRESRQSLNHSRWVRNKQTRGVGGKILCFGGVMDRSYQHSTAMFDKWIGSGNLLRLR